MSAFQNNKYVRMLNMSAFQKEKYVCISKGEIYLHFKRRNMSAFQRRNMSAFQREKGIYAVKYVRISFCQLLKLPLHLISSFHLSFWQSKELLLNIWHQKLNIMSILNFCHWNYQLILTLLKILMTFLWGNVDFSLETKVLLDKNGLREVIKDFLIWYFLSSREIFFFCMKS